MQYGNVYKTMLPLPIQRQYNNRARLLISPQPKDRLTDECRHQPRQSGRDAGLDRGRDCRGERRSVTGRGSRRDARQEGCRLGADEDARRHEPGRAQGDGSGAQRPEAARDGGDRRPARGAEGHRPGAPARRGAARRDARPAPRRADPRPHPPHQPGVGGALGDLRRSRVPRRRGAGHRDGRPQLHQAELPRGPSRAGHARHLLPARAARTGRAACCAPTRAPCRSARC